MNRTKKVNFVPPDVRFSGKNAPNSISAGAPPQTPPGSLQRSPDPLPALKGPTSKGRGKRGEAKERGEYKGKGMEKEEREGKGLRA